MWGLRGLSPHLAYFFAEEADITDAGPFRNVDHLDYVAVRELGTGADERVLVRARAVDFLKL